MFLTTAAGTQNHALPRSDALISYGTGRACYRVVRGIPFSRTSENSVKAKVAERSIYALRGTPLSYHCLSSSILGKSPVPAAQSVDPRYLCRASRPRSRQLLASRLARHRSAQRLPSY
jgi:hypothetical protein